MLYKIVSNVCISPLPNSKTWEKYRFQLFVVYHSDRLRSLWDMEVYRNLIATKIGSEGVLIYNSHFLCLPILLIWQVFAFSDFIHRDELALFFSLLWNDASRISELICCLITKFSWRTIVFISVVIVAEWNCIHSTYDDNQWVLYFSLREDNLSLLSRASDPFYLGYTT